MSEVAVIELTDLQVIEVNSSNNPEIVEVESDQIVEIDIIESPQVVEIVPETLTIIQQTIIGGGTSSALYAEGHTPISLSGHRVVLDLPELRYADTDDSESGTSKLYLTFGSSTAGACTVLAEGIIEEPTWNWVPQKSIFLSTNGFLTQTAPINSLFTRIIGYAESTTSIYFDPQLPIFNTN